MTGYHHDLEDGFKHGTTVPQLDLSRSNSRVHPTTSFSSSASAMTDVKYNLSTVQMENCNTGSSTCLVTGVNIINAILGTGMLSLPLAFSQASVAFGIVTVIFVYVITIWAVYYVV